jgi:hypothetical protein
MQGPEAVHNRCEPIMRNQIAVEREAQVRYLR